MRSPASAVDQLKSDHRELKRLRQLWEAETDGTPRSTELMETCLQDLELHCKLENELFYPVCRKMWIGSIEPLDDAEDDDALIANLIDEIRIKAPSQRTEDFQRLMNLMSDHFKEEEQLIFPKFEDLISLKDYKALASSMASRRTWLRLMANHQRKAA